MSRFNLKHNFSKYNDDDEEETLFERKALIDDDDYDADTSEATSTEPRVAKIRKRQLASTLNNNQLISQGGNNIISLDQNQVHTAILHDVGNHELSGLHRTKNANRTYTREQNFDYSYYNIQNGDTLQRICLRYACPIALVKRINGLMTDQDFYGLTRIKLPLGRLGLLEDVLRQGDSQNVALPNNCSDIDELSFTRPDDNNGSVNRPRFVNSPGTALSISSSSNRLQQSLPNSEQRLDLYNETDLHKSDLDRSSSVIGTTPNAIRMVDHHAYSFPSLSQLNNGDVNIMINRDSNQQQKLNIISSRSIKDQTFIDSEIKNDSLIDADDLQAVRQENVQKVFKHLDFHVGKAKEAAENYDQRATDLVQEISNGHDQFIEYSQTKVSKIPQLFRCNENFGLNQTKLFSFIIIVCLIIPLLYIFYRPNIKN